MEFIAAQIKSVLAAAQVSLADSMSTSMEVMEARLSKMINQSVQIVVEKSIKDRQPEETIRNVIRDITMDHQAKGTNGVAEVIPNPPVPLHSDVRGENSKLSFIANNLDPSRDLDFGNGLILKDKDLLELPLTIPPSRPDVMDACVMTLRDSILTNMEPLVEPRDDFLPSSWTVAMAKQYPKFEKSTRKELFEFDDNLIGMITARATVARKEWIKDIDFVYFPFVVDKNRWVGVMVDLISARLTVFDPAASERRDSRIKPEFEFICEMFHYLVRKAADNDGMKEYELSPLLIRRDTTVPQASNRSLTGILTLLILEAHAYGGLAKAYSVEEGHITQRAEKLAVKMYEHCCGEVDLA